MEQTVGVGSLDRVIVRYDVGIERLVEGTATSAPGLSVWHERKEPMQPTSKAWQLALCLGNNKKGNLARTGGAWPNQVDLR